MSGVRNINSNAGLFTGRARSLLLAIIMVSGSVIVLFPLSEQASAATDWSPIMMLSAGSNPDIAISNGYVHVISSSGGYMRSGDGGETWSTPAAPSGQEIAAGGSNVFILSGGSLLTSDDDGDTWNGPFAVASSYKSIELDATDGKAHIVYLDNSGMYEKTFYVNATSDGILGTPVQINYNGDFWGPVDISASDNHINVVEFWGGPGGPSGSTNTVMGYYSNDTGSSWSGDAVGGGYYYPWFYPNVVSISASGNHVHMAQYYPNDHDDYENPGQCDREGSGIYLGSSSNYGEGGYGASLIYGPLDCGVGQVDVASNGASSHVVWSTTISGIYQIVYEGEQLTFTLYDSTNPEIAVDNTDSPHIVWEMDGNVYYAHKGDTVTGYYVNCPIPGYLTIQEAVNAASDGDMVYVCAGTYIEEVFITKDLYMVGEGTPLIQGSVYSTKYLSIDGFEVIGGSTWGGAFEGAVGVKAVSLDLYNMDIDATWAVFSDDIGTVSDTVISGWGFPREYGIYGGSVDTVKNSTIGAGGSDNSNAIRANVNRIENSTITGGDDIGGVIYGNVGELVNSTVSGRIGINGHVDYIIRSTVEGIDEFGDGGYSVKSADNIIDSIISATHFGVYDSVEYVEGSTISSATGILHLHYAVNTTFLPNEFDYSQLSFYTVDSLDHVTTVLNCTFDDVYVYPGDLLDVQWFMDVYVQDTDGSPVAGATVRVQDNANGTFDENHTTGADGHARWIPVTEYIEDDTSRTYYTPHNVTATKDAATGWTDPEPRMDQSETVTVILDLSVNSPPSITTIDIKQAEAGQFYYNDYDATDADVGDTLIWSLTTDASWLFINSTSGELSGTPDTADIGTYWANVSVSDGNGGVDFCTFNLGVFSWLDHFENGSRVTDSENVTIESSLASLVPTLPEVFLYDDFPGSSLDPQWTETNFDSSGMTGTITVTGGNAVFDLNSVSPSKDHALVTTDYQIPVPATVKIGERANLGNLSNRWTVSIHDQATKDAMYGVSCATEVYWSGTHGGVDWLADNTYHELTIEITATAVTWYKNDETTPFLTTTGLNLSQGFRLSFDGQIGDGSSFIDAWIDYVNITHPASEHTSWLASEEIALPTDGVWETLYVEKTVPAQASLTVSVLNASSLEPIPGYTDLTGTETNLSALDPDTYPSIRLRAEFDTTNESQLPHLDYWAIDWQVVPAGPVFLTPGDNYISISKVQTDTSIDTVLASIAGKYDRVTVYDPTDAGDHWKDYTTYKPAWMNELTDIDHTMAIYISITDPEGAMLEVSGDDFTDSTNNIQLYTDWNHVGFPSLSDKTRDAGLNNLAVGVEIGGAYRYDSATDEWLEMTAGDSFEVGQAYRVYANQDCLWDVPV